MNALVAVVVGKLFELLWPKLRDLLVDLFKEWMPKLMEATVVAQLAAAEKLASGTVDKITDAIPGTADDKLIDPIVSQVFGSPIVRDFLGGFGIRL
jgi:hypothetical protein